MSYVINFIKANIKDKNENFIEYFEVLLEEIGINTYGDTAEFLNDNYDFLNPANVEFGSLLLESLMSWGEVREFEEAVGIDSYDDDDIYNNADVLLKYEETVGIPEDMMKKLETYAILKDFKNKYKDINDDNKNKFDTNMIKDVINDQKYDVNDPDQAGALAKLVYFNFSDDNQTFSQSTYPFTRMMNQIALNADLDKDVMYAMESETSDWYADKESIETQLNKVGMADININDQKMQKKDKKENRLTQEVVDKLKKEYEGILDIDFSKGHTGLESQTNDSIVVKFDNKVIYEDTGTGNQFGDTTLNGKALFQLLKDNDYKTVANVFFF